MLRCRARRTAPRGGKPAQPAGEDAAARSLPRGRLHRDPAGGRQEREVQADEGEEVISPKMSSRRTPGQRDRLSRIQLGALKSVQEDLAFGMPRVVNSLIGIRLPVGETMMFKKIAIVAGLGLALTAAAEAQTPRKGGTIRMTAPYGSSFTSLDIHTTPRAQDEIFAKGLHRRSTSGIRRRASRCWSWPRRSSSRRTVWSTPSSCATTPISTTAAR